MRVDAIATRSSDPINSNNSNALPAPAHDPAHDPAAQPAAISPNGVALYISERIERSFNLIADEITQVFLVTANVDFHIRAKTFPGGQIRYQAGREIRLTLAALRRQEQVYGIRSAEGAGDGTLLLKRISPSPIFSLAR